MTILIDNGNGTIYLFNISKWGDPYGHEPCGSGNIRQGGR